MNFEVHRNDVPVAKCVHSEDAAALVAVSGGQIKVRKNLVWDEGKEAQPAGDSYDFVANTISQRLQALKPVTRPNVAPATPEITTSDTPANPTA